MLRLFGSFWQQALPPKPLGGDQTPVRPVACSEPSSNAEASRSAHQESNVRTVREERFLIIDETSGKASVSLRREETISRTLYTTGGSTFQWRKATPAQAADALRAEQMRSDTPVPYRNFQGNILAEQTIAPGALPQLQTQALEQHTEQPKPQPQPRPQPQRLENPKPQPQRNNPPPRLQLTSPSTVGLYGDEAAMDLELSVLAENERMHSLGLDDHGCTSGSTEDMELDEFSFDDSRCKELPNEIVRRMAAKHYINLARKLKHPYAEAPPRSRSACVADLHRQVLNQARACISASKT